MSSGAFEYFKILVIIFGGGVFKISVIIDFIGVFLDLRTFQDFKISVIIYLRGIFRGLRTFQDFGYCLFYGYLQGSLNISRLWYLFIFWVVFKISVMINFMGIFRGLRTFQDFKISVIIHFMAEGVLVACSFRSRSRSRHSSDEIDIPSAFQWADRFFEKLDMPREQMRAPVCKPLASRSAEWLLSMYFMLSMHFIFSGYLCLYFAFCI